MNGHIHINNNRPLTRTVALINSSRFLRAYCFLERLSFTGHPDTLICSLANFCTVINSWLRVEFVPRSLRKVASNQILHVINSWSPANLYRDCACAPEKLYHDWQKPRRASRPTALENLKVYSRNTAHGLRSLS